MAIEPDGKDWTWVLERACPDCGFDPATVTRAGVADRIRRSADDWDAVLAAPSANLRPDEKTWSPLEYACHVRDVHAVMRERLGLMLGEQPARFASWDQDAAAIERDYATQDPIAVGDQLRVRAAEFADAYARVADDKWDREGLRSNGSAFTVESFAAYALHDLEHHRVDVGLPAREDWSTPAGLREIAARHRTRIPGWRDPAGFAVGYHPDGGDWVFPVVNGPAAAKSLTAVLLAEVVGDAGAVEPGVYPMGPGVLDRAIASLARAEATAELKHPNLAAWREARDAGPGTVVAVFLGEGAADHPAYRALARDARLG